RLERHIVGDPPPDLLNPGPHCRRIGIIVAHDHPAERAAAVAEDDRLDRAAHGAETGVVDDADDRDRRQPIGIGIVNRGAERLADRLTRIAEAELTGGEFVDHDIHAARNNTPDALLAPSRVYRRLVARTVAIEDAA